MSEKPPQGGTPPPEDPPVDPEIAKEVQKMHKEVNTLQKAIKEDLHTKGVTLSEIPLEADQLDERVKSLKALISNYRRAKTRRDRIVAQYKIELDLLGTRVATDVQSAANKIITERAARYAQGGPAPEDRGPESRAEWEETLKDAVDQLTPEEIERNEADQAAGNESLHKENQDEANDAYEKRAERMKKLQEEIDEFNHGLDVPEGSTINAEVWKRQEELNKLEAEHSTTEEEAAPDNSNWNEVHKTKNEKYEDLKAKARSTRGAEAVDKLEQELGGKRTSDERFDEAAPHANKMYDAEKAYLDALKEHHQKRNIVGVMFEQFAGHKESKEVQKLRADWVEARAGYASYLRQRASEKLVSKKQGYGADITDKEGMEKYHKVMERYQRRVTAYEVVIGAEEAEQRAKMEGLSLREKGWVDKSFEWYKRQPAFARVLGTSLLFTGAAALVAGAGAYAAVPLALGGVRAISRWLAEANPNTKVGNTLTWVGRITSVGAIAGMIAEYGTRAVHGAWGTKRKAGERLVEREDLGNLGSAKQLDKLSKGRKNALNVEENISRQSRWARIIGSFAGGAWFGHAAHDYVEKHTDHVTFTGNHPEANTAGFTMPGRPFSDHTMGAVPLTPEAMAHAQSLHEFGGGNAAEASHDAGDHAASESHAEEHEGVATAEHHEQHHNATHERHHTTHERHTAAASHNHAETAEAKPVHLTDEDRNLIQEWELKYGGLPPHSDMHTLEVIERLRQNDGPDAFKDVHFEAVSHETPVHDTEPAHDDVNTERNTERETQPAAPTEATREATDPNVTDHEKPTVTEATPEATDPKLTDEPHGRTFGEPYHSNAIPHERTFGEPYHPAPLHFTNAHHVEVNLAKPHFYSWKMPDSKEVFPVVDGGTLQERAEFMKKVFDQHPELKRMLSIDIDPNTHKPEIHEYFRETFNQPTHMPGSAYNPDTHEEIPIPDPKDYIQSPKEYRIIN